MSIEIIALFCTLLIGGIYVIVYTMYQKLSLAIDRLAKQSSKQSDNVISQIEALLALYAEVRPEHGLPPTRGWAASPDFLRILIQIFTEEYPTTVVECSSGLSTLILAGCLKNHKLGHVYSLEHDPEFAAKTRNMLRLHKLEAWATVIDAPLKELSLPGWEGKWYDTSALPKNIAIDMLVIDGPPQATSPLARYPALHVLGEQMRSGSTVILDDANRDDEQEIVVRWQQELKGFSPIRVNAAEKGASCMRKI